MSERAEPRLLSGKQAAHYCGFKSVHGFVANIPVPPVNFGRYVRYDRKAIDKYLDGLSQSLVVGLSGRVGNAGENCGN